MITQEQIKEDQQTLEEMYKKYDLRVHELTMAEQSSKKDRLVLMCLSGVLEVLESAIREIRQFPDYETY